jgi:hypothetical protein
LQWRQEGGETKKIPPKIERETLKLVMFIQYLDQLVGKTSLGKEINKKQVKKLGAEEKSQTSEAGVQKGRSKTIFD